MLWPCSFKSNQFCLFRAVAVATALFFLIPKIPLKYSWFEVLGIHRAPLRSENRRGIESERVLRRFAYFDLWCPRRDLNSHVLLGTTDFKSAASTGSATRTSLEGIVVHHRRYCQLLSNMFS